LRLFTEIILDVWKQKQLRTASVRESLTKRCDDLKHRKDLLVEAFVYRRQLDERTYQEQVDKLNEEITLAEIEEKDSRLEELDIESVIAFARHVLLNAARIWAESRPDQKQRLQKLLFPAGVMFSSGAYRTTRTSSIFFELQEITLAKESLVALPGIEPGFED
jgi:hypothetical protein